MVQRMSEADIYAMFERVGVDPVEQDQQDLQDLMTKRDQTSDTITYRTILTNGTGKSMLGGTDAELERNSR